MNYLDLQGMLKQKSPEENMKNNQIQYNQRTNYLGMLPKPTTGPPPPNALDIMQNKTDPYSMLLRMRGQTPQKKIQPKEVNLKAKETVNIIGPDEDISQGDKMLGQELRRKAQAAQKWFGEDVARILYGDKVVDELPLRNVPPGYEGAYVKNGKWYVPGKGQVEPPPKEGFIASPKEYNVVEKGLEWVLPDSLAHLSDKLYEILHGPPSQQFQAMQDVTMGALEYMALYQKLPGVKFMGADNGFELINKTLKGAVKAGMVPPRLLFKTLAKIDNKLFLPIREAAWEKIIVTPMNKRIIPTYEGKKSMAEIFQPAVERLEKIGKDKIFRSAQAQRQLVVRIGQEMGSQVKYLSPSERLELGKALRGEQVNSPKVKRMVRSFKKKVGTLNLETEYQNHFHDQLGKLFQGENFGFGLEHEMPFLDQIALNLGKSLNQRMGIKETQKVLKEMIEHPLVPKGAKALALDLHNMPAGTPEAVAEAGRYAMKHAIVDKLKSDPSLVRTALGAGDNAEEWMLSKHPLMKGLWVKRDAELELRAMEEIPKMAQNTFNKWFMTPWKTAKVILRPATHFRNMISNAILNDWGGLPFYRMDYYADALKQMRGKSKLWKEFARITGGGGTFSSEEINQMAAGLKYGANMYDVGMAMFDKMADSKFLLRPRSTYNAEEQWFKFAKYLWNKKDGMDPIEAAYDAMRWTFNYGEVSRATAFVRGYIAPFYTWQSKVIPLMAETVVKHPLRIGKWFMFYKALQANSLQQLRISDDEWKNIEYIMPEYIQEGQMLLLPWRDQQQRLQLLNLTYMIPGFGDLSELAAHPSGSIIGNPLTALAGEIRLKRKWSGAPLYYDWEDNSTKMMKILSHTWQSVAPSWAPGAFDWNQMNDVIQDVEGAPTWQQMIASQFGFKITPINEANARRSRIVIDQIHKQEIGSQMKRELRRASSDKERVKIIDQYQKLRRKIGMSYDDDEE